MIGGVVGERMVDGVIDGLIDGLIDGRDDRRVCGLIESGKIVDDRRITGEMGRVFGGGGMIAGVEGAHEIWKLVAGTFFIFISLVFIVFIIFIVIFIVIFFLFV